MKRATAAAAVLITIFLAAGCGQSSEYYFTPDNSRQGGDPAGIQCGIVTYAKGDWKSTTYQQVGRVCKVNQ